MNCQTCGHQVISMQDTCSYCGQCASKGNKLVRILSTSPETNSPWLPEIILRLFRRGVVRH